MEKAYWYDEILANIRSYLIHSMIYMDWFRQDTSWARCFSMFKHKECVRKGSPPFRSTNPFEILHLFKRIYSKIASSNAESSNPKQLTHDHLEISLYRKVCLSASSSISSLSLCFFSFFTSFGAESLLAHMLLS